MLTRRAGPAARCVAFAGMDAWALAAIAAILLAAAAASGLLQRSHISAAMFFVTTGLLAGPVLGVVDLPIAGGPIEFLAEVTLTFVLFADASRISLPKLRREYAVPLRLLGLGLPLSIVAGAVVGVVVLPGVGAAEAFLLAVILACTDAALGQAVVTDERLPSRIRQGLNVESGLNDGLCVPLFWIALSLAQVEEGVTTADAALRLVVDQIGFGIVAGVVAGMIGVARSGQDRLEAGSRDTGSRSCRRRRHCWRPGSRSLCTAASSSPRSSQVSCSGPRSRRRVAR